MWRVITAYGERADAGSARRYLRACACARARLSTACEGHGSRSGHTARVEMVGEGRVWCKMARGKQRGGSRSGALCRGRARARARAGGGAHKDSEALYSLSSARTWRWMEGALVR